MDQVGYAGVDEHSFVDAANGKTPPPEGGAGPGVTTDSLLGTTTAGFGKLEQEGLVGRRRRS